MTLEQMRYFLEVAKTEHVGRAALALHVSPSTVSHAVAQLETGLGSPLFERQGKHIRITDSGGVFRDRVALILGEVASLQQDIRGDSWREKRHLRFAATHLLAGALLTPAWQTASARHEYSSVDLLACRSADVVNFALEGAIDLGVCFSPVAHPDLNIESLVAGHLRLVVHRKHPLAGEPAARVLKQLAEFPCSMPKPLAGVEVCEVHPVLALHGLQIEAKTRYDSLETAAALLADERTFSLIPDLCTAWMSPELVTLAVPNSWVAPYSLCAVLQRKRSVSPAVGALLKALRVLSREASRAARRRK
jgi:LysR family transcriptional regulator, cyn operon transcriptional activator